MEYRLLDFGDGLRIESVGGRILSRPSPVAEDDTLLDPDSQKIDARFDLIHGHAGTWTELTGSGKSWEMATWFGRMQLTPSPFGHIGVFPEQLENWDWLRSQGDRLRGLRLLNLFAYTGGTTLAAAALGAEVTHVDSARNTVERARENARLCSLESAPIRWIVEDVPRFVAREIRRGRPYDGVILDPPTWGHGVSKGQKWDVYHDLAGLIESVAKLVGKDTCQLLLLTCHSPGFDASHLLSLVREAFKVPPSVEARPMQIPVFGNPEKQLPAGDVVRWFV